MTDMPNTPKRKVLVSGASIAGPALAFWLNRCGYEVTVVERAGAVRAGGYAIDVRGTALEVVERMGILPRLQDAHIDLRQMTFLDGDGAQVASIRPGEVTGRDLEVRRGDVAEALYDAVRDDVEFLFGDCIETLDESGDGVDVTFRGGGRRTFDLVFGAEGMHSRTREMLFGPEERFHRYLGYCFAVFTMPNTLGLANEVVMWNTPGRAAALFAMEGDGEAQAFLNFVRPEPPFEAFGDPEAQRKLVAEVFADAGWEVPGILAAMRETDDVFFDTAGQIRMPRWSSGRVALVGDAAYAPSFFSGQGTSLALVGAYMLAHSLAGRDHVAGFAAYEHDMREFVTLNQGLADMAGSGASLFPNTAEALEQRNNRLRTLTVFPTRQERPVHSALTLPEFTTMTPGYAR